MTVELVRNGETVKTRGLNCILEMLLQITRDYSGLPDPRTLSFEEIKFFYEGLKPDLIKVTGQKNG